jgi:hypothetical protein
MVAWSRELANNCGQRSRRKFSMFACWRDIVPDVKRHKLWGAAEAWRQ